MIFGLTKTSRGSIIISASTASTSILKNRCIQNMTTKRFNDTGRKKHNPRDESQKQSNNLPQEPSSTKPKNLSQQNIFGENLISCRDFSLTKPKKFQFIGSYNSLNQIPIYPLPEIAFIGRSNVGKSSLLNTLTGLNKKLAKESKTPGRTQSINLFKCSDEDGDLCMFVDLPGYGFAKISKTLQDDISHFLMDYLNSRGALKVAVLLVDSRRDPQQLDTEMAQVLEELGIPYVMIATKVDKLKKDELFDNLEGIRSYYNLPQGQPIAFSSISGVGRKETWKAIRSEILDVDDPDDEVDEEEESDEK
eukprot:gene13636-18298_t